MIYYRPTQKNNYLESKFLKYRTHNHRIKSLQYTVPLCHDNVKSVKYSNRYVKLPVKVIADVDVASTSCLTASTFFSLAYGCFINIWKYDVHIFVCTCMDVNWIIIRIDRDLFLASRCIPHITG